VPHHPLTPWTIQCMAQTFASASIGDIHDRRALPARFVQCEALGMDCDLPRVILGVASGNAAQTHRDRKQIEKATRLQVFLDTSNFGPGKIDGKDGAFTRKAVMLFKRSRGQSDLGAQDSKTSIDTTGLDLSGIDPVFTTYFVTKGDIENVGEAPSSPAAQAKAKWLPYRNVAEAVAEKFHCDLNFLKELNPGIIEKLKEGDQVTVPNVQPFELSAVKTATTAAEGIAEQDKQGHSQTAEIPTGVFKEETQPVSLYIITKENILEVHVGEKLAAVFPVTVGSQHTASPIGHWTIKAIAKFPNFRYDLRMLEEGKRSSNSTCCLPDQTTLWGDMDCT
jgi:lipoprotein-anchoring transpeptidase ErfK/SrfK